MICWYKYFMPDKIYNNVYEIDFDGLLEKGVKGLIFDIDNTLVSYRQPEPTAEVTELMRSLRDKGFSVCFVSNNKKERVDLFNQDFKFPAFAEAGKPLKKYMKRALEAMGAAGNQAAIIGDQLFTDVCAGKRMDMLALFVYPIEPVETLFFKAKRALEKPIIKKYRRLENAKKV
jgi:HAD superfamily phosphatase (TIGR01668 family)